MIVGGSVGSTYALQSIDPIGTLPYNEYGWATIVFLMSYLPSGATCSWRLRDPGNTTDILKLDFDGTNLLRNGTVLLPWTAADRYQLLIHLNRDGRATCSLHDLTASVSQRRWWSADLGGWTPQAIGVVRQEAVRGSANYELDGMMLFSWLNIAGVDSLTGTFAATVTPNMAMANNIAAQYWYGQEIWGIPGGNWPYKASGVPRHPMVVIAGRAGGTSAQFNDNVMAGMTFTRGIRLCLFDGGSVNDLGTVVDAASRASFIASWSSQRETWIRSMTSVGNRVWLSTMMRREPGLGTTWSAQQIAAMNDISTQHRRMARELQVPVAGTLGGLIELSDPAADVPVHATVISGDNTHPDAAGNITIATAMNASRTTPALYPVPRSLTGPARNKR